MPPAGQAPSGAPIFNPAVLHEARLDLDPSAWRALRDNFLSNQYYAANLTVDGVAVQQVGIRSRGEGSRSEDKPGLKVEFDKYVPAQEYYGYKSLVLDNMTQDPSFLRERLSFLVFEAMGIAAPRNAFARLTVNGEYWGLYALVEPVSKPFLEARLGEKSGTLFDYEWIFPYDFSWRGPNAGDYVPLPFQPETNETRPDVADGLVAFIQAINETPDASFLATMEGLPRRRSLPHPRGGRERDRRERRDRGRLRRQQLLPLRVRREEPLRLHPLGQGRHASAAAPGRSTATWKRTSSPAA